jgi:hypothetical protein
MEYIVLYFKELSQISKVSVATRKNNKMEYWEKDGWMHEKCNGSFLNNLESNT